MSQRSGLMINLCFSFSQGDWGKVCCGISLHRWWTGHRHHHREHSLRKRPNHAHSEVYFQYHPNSKYTTPYIPNRVHAIYTLECDLRFLSNVEFKHRIASTWNVRISTPQDFCMFDAYFETSQDSTTYTRRNTQYLVNYSRKWLLFT